MESPPLLFDHRNKSYCGLKCHSNFSLSTISPFSTGQNGRNSKRIFLALTDFVVGARVKGNPRQMSDKLQFVAA